MAQHDKNHDRSSPVPTAQPAGTYPPAADENVQADNRRADGKLPHNIPHLRTDDTLTALASNLMRATRNGLLRVIMVSSCNDGEGKTTAVLNTAYAISREAGQKVLVMDINPDGPVLADLFKVQGKPGLTDVLAGKFKLDEAILPAADTCFDFLPFGSRDRGRLAIFSSDHGRQLQLTLDELREKYDLILLDGPSIFGASDPLIIAPQVDGVIMVVECERTRWEVLTAAEEQLRHLGAHPMGVVMNRRRYYIPKNFYGE